MKNILVIYHSQTGNTEALAKAVYSGVQQEENVNARLLKAFDAKLDDLLWCDGLLIGTPENFGYMSGAIKDFFDRTYQDAQPLELNLPYAIFVSADNDGTGAVREINRIMKGYVFKQAIEPLIVKGTVEPANLSAAEELGLSLACGVSMGIF